MITTRQRFEKVIRSTAINDAFKQIALARLSMLSNDYLEKAYTDMSSKDPERRKETRDQLGNYLYGGLVSEK